LVAETELPFEYIRITTGGGLVRSLTADEFLVLPLHTRVRWLLDDSIEFYRGSTLVDRRVALAALRRANAPG
jgi:hypothetical protein